MCIILYVPVLRQEKVGHGSSHVKLGLDKVACKVYSYLLSISNKLILELRNEGENGILIDENIGYIQTLV